MQARRALTVVQFAAAIVLSAMAMMVVLQSYAASHQDLGFKTNDMLGVDIPGNAPAATASAARDAIARLPGVKSVSIAFDLPGRDQSININLIKRGDQAAQEMRFMPVTPDYFGQYGIPILAGRNLADKENDAILLDEQAAQILGYANPADAVGQSVQLGEKTTMIRGVVANTRLESARQATMPKVYAAKQKLLGAISVETADIAATRQQIEALWPRYFPEDAPFIDTIQNYIDARYADDLRFGELIGMASIISLLLAGFGVYALAAYTVRRKTREIVLRKLYGAPSLAIASLLGREFGLLLALGAAIGLPLAALLVARFQAGFVVQAPVGGWAMLAGLIMTALLTVLATGRHIRIALRLPPVQALQG
jgi:putative ABC transport system permease protein